MKVINGNLVADFSGGYPGLPAAIINGNPEEISYYAGVINNGAGGALENEVTRARAALMGGSTHADAQIKFYDNFQSIRSADPYPLGYRASAATVNPLHALHADNTSFEQGTAGTWAAVNGALDVIATDARHGVRSCRFTSDGNANGGIGLDVTAATSNAQYTLTVMVKAANEGMVGESCFARLAGDVSGATDGTAVTLTRDWQQISVTKTFAGDSVRNAYVLVSAPEGGDAVLVDCCQIVAGSVLLPFTTQEATAASATLPTPFSAGEAFTALFLVWTPWAGDDGVGYILFDCEGTSATQNRVHISKTVASKLQFVIRDNTSAYRYSEIALNAESWPVGTPKTVAVSADEYNHQRLALGGMITTFSLGAGVRESALGASSAIGSYSSGSSYHFNCLILPFFWRGVAFGDAELRYLSSLQAPPPRNRMWW